MLKCVFPTLLANMSLQGISLHEMSSTIGRSPDAVRKKLAGTSTFGIDEAMKINEQLFPLIPFKDLFYRAPTPTTERSR